MTSNYLAPVYKFSIFIGKALLVASLASIASAQTNNCPPPLLPPTPEKMQAIARAAKDHGFLWKIEKNGLSGYLYGSIHVGKSEWAVPGPKLLAAIQSSDAIALELDILDPKVQAQMADIEQFGIKNIVLPAALTQRLKKVAQRVCAPEETAKQHPLLQLSTLALFSARFQQLEVAYGSEIFLASLARLTNKPVIGLETAESQIRALLDGEEKDIIESVKSSLTQLEKDKQNKQINRLATYWAKSDLANLQNFEKWCECMNTEADRKFLKRINQDRNPGLAAGIDKSLQGGKHVFAAVGSLHMIGPKGLPTLLKAMGYKVERVMFDQ